MASPQTENGYTMLANELLDAFCKTRISGEARQVLDVIIRKTYGFKKKKDKIALSVFSETTGIQKPHVVRAIKKLQDMNIIKVLNGSTASIYCLNKNHNEWLALPKKVTANIVANNGNKLVPKKVTAVAKKGNESLPKKESTKETKRNSLKKERKEIFSLSHKLYPGTKRTEQTEYKELLKHPDSDKVISLILPAIENQIAWRKELENTRQLVPSWQTFKNWIAFRNWEMLVPTKKRDDYFSKYGNVCAFPECELPVSITIEKRGFCSKEHYDQLREAELNNDNWIKS